MSTEDEAMRVARELADEWFRADGYVWCVR